MKIEHTRNTLSKTYLDATKIRKQVFILGQGVPSFLEMDDMEAHCIHFVLYDEQNTPCATCRLLPNPSSSDQVILQRMAVLDSYQGQGLGRQILQTAENFAQEQGFHKISLHAQLAAYNFYIKNGYQRVRDVFEEAGIQHVTMEKYVRGPNLS